MSQTQKDSLNIQCSETRWWQHGVNKDPSKRIENTEELKIEDHVTIVYNSQLSLEENNLLEEKIGIKDGIAAIKSDIGNVSSEVGQTAFCHTKEYKETREGQQDIFFLSRQKDLHGQTDTVSEDDQDIISRAVNMFLPEELPGDTRQVSLLRQVTSTISSDEYNRGLSRRTNMFCHRHSQGFSPLEIAQKTRIMLPGNSHQMLLDCSKSISEKGCIQARADLRCNFESSLGEESLAKKQYISTSTQQQYTQTTTFSKEGVGLFGYYWDDFDNFSKVAIVVFCAAVLQTVFSTLDSALFKARKGRCLPFCGLERVNPIIFVILASKYFSEIPKEKMIILEAMAEVQSDCLIGEHDKHKEKRSSLLTLKALYKISDSDVHNEIKKIEKLRSKYENKTNVEIVREIRIQQVKRQL